MTNKEQQRLCKNNGHQNKQGEKFINLKNKESEAELRSVCSYSLAQKGTLSNNAYASYIREYYGW